MRMGRNGDICVDKSGLIELYVCLSCPRRFGKTVTASMLCAYYQWEIDAHILLEDLEVAHASDFERRLDQIRSRNYPPVLRGWGGEIVLAGVAYDEKTRRHRAVIEWAG